jgi:hypothetical protein
MMHMMRRLARWHIWLGWLIGVPLLLWTASGLFMVAWPIEQVRGGQLRTEPKPMALAGLAVPKAGPVTQLILVDEAGRQVWVATAADGALRRFDARSGLALPLVDQAEAQAIAAASYRGGAKLESMAQFAANAAPIELRRERPSWQARFGDGTHVYVDAGTGEVLALRSRLWRAFDFMWGLHIMDLQGREDTHHPLLIGFAGLAFLGTLLGTVLLFRRRKAGVSNRSA